MSILFFGTPNNDCANCRCFKRPETKTSSLSGRVEVSSHCEIHFRRSWKKLRMHAAAPMWRNGRRNGLKIRWAVIGPCRFESGHRHYERAVFIGEFARKGDLSGADGGARRRKKRLFMCQVFVKSSTREAASSTQSPQS